MLEEGLGGIEGWWEGAGSGSRGQGWQSPAKERISIAGTIPAAGGKHGLPGAQR